MSRASYSRCRKSGDRSSAEAKLVRLYMIQCVASRSYTSSCAQRRILIAFVVSKYSIPSSSETAIHHFRPGSSFPIFAGTLRSIGGFSMSVIHFYTTIQSKTVHSKSLISWTDATLFLYNYVVFVPPSPDTEHKGRHLLLFPFLLFPEDFVYTALVYIPASFPHEQGPLKAMTQRPGDKGETPPFNATPKESPAPVKCSCIPMHYFHTTLIQ